MAKKNEVEVPMGEGERAAITGRLESDAEKSAQTEAATADRLRQLGDQIEAEAGAQAKAMAGDSVQRYGVVRPTLHNDRIRHRGEAIYLSPKEAKHLLETKAIGIISEQPVFLVDGEPIVSTDRVLPPTADVLLEKVLA